MPELKRILLAEDDPDDVELILSALSEVNLASEVLVAGDGSEALNYLLGRGGFAGRPAGNPVVVVLDLKMPKIGGLQVLRAMKSDPRLESVPVVVFTSSREPRDVAECFKLGANAYVVKPVQFADFVDTVKKLGIFWALVNQPPPDKAAASDGRNGSQHAC
ncbi:MAG TPA: response regulator [Bryobacteraceae bacterium]|jgi:CheY-like chemotaxis protein|nr:response regulator [Bryobacteraceae bacterium]